MRSVILDIHSQCLVVDCLAKLCHFPIFQVEHKSKHKSKKTKNKMENENGATMQKLIQFIDMVKAFKQSMNDKLDNIISEMEGKRCKVCGDGIYYGWKRDYCLDCERERIENEWRNATTTDCSAKEERKQLREELRQPSKPEPKTSFTFGGHPKSTYEQDNLPDQRTHVGNLCVLPESYYKAKNVYSTC